MQGLAPREAVLDILLAQEETGAFLKDLFPRHADALAPSDRALAREMALGVIRHRTLLDFNIDRLAAKPPKPGPLRQVLRLAAYQILFLNVPDFAAVNTGVELAKRRVGPGQAGFVNAVLKKMAAQGLQREPGDSLKALATNHSHPLWLVERWHKRLGPQGLLAALERNNQEAPLWIRANPDRVALSAAAPPPGEDPGADAVPQGVGPGAASRGSGPGELLRAALADLGVPSEPDPAAPHFLRLPEGQGSGAKALRSELFARGALAFQDPAAWWVAELAAWHPRESLLDLCAAPGGKSACLVERAALRGEIPPGGRAAAVCNDLSFRRLRRIRDARERLGHRGLLPVVMDPAHGALRRRFDCVVVDAPCSNLGVIRRRPEARWSHYPKDLRRLAAVQGALLAQAADLVTSKGRLVYATCSPEPEESLDVVKAFLASRPDFVLEDASAFLPAWAVKEGCLWLHPGETDYDGFFAARLARREPA